MQENIYYNWETKEYNHNNVNPDWIWALGIIAIIILVLSIMYQNYLFGILMLIGTSCIIYLKLRTPKLIHISITDRYIGIGEEERYYQDLKNFWIDATNHKVRVPHLLIATKRNLTPLITIAIPHEISITELRTKLLVHLEEKQMQESGIYEIMEKLGF
jgi:hypothetical protein